MTGPPSKQSSDSWGQQIQLTRRLISQADPWKVQDSDLLGRTEHGSWGQKEELPDCEHPFFPPPLPYAPYNTLILRQVHSQKKSVYALDPLHGEMNNNQKYVCVCIHIRYI